MESKILLYLAEMKKAHKELRYTQIMSIAAKNAGWEGDDLFYCPDRLILDGLEKMLEV